MRITGIDRLDDYGHAFADARPALRSWVLVVHGADWRNIHEVRQTYAHADSVKAASGRNVTVFNIKGNRYRLIVAIDYPLQVVNVLQFLTHAEYSKGRWKESL